MIKSEYEKNQEHISYHTFYKQLLPGNGWRAVYADIEGDCYWSTPVEFWALKSEFAHCVEDDCSNLNECIVGLSLSNKKYFSEIDEDVNFLGYLRPGEDIEIYKKDFEETKLKNSNEKN